MNNPLSIALIVSSGIFGGLASILLRIAAVAPPNFSGLFSMPNFLRATAILSYGLGFIAYALALKKYSLSTAYPAMVAVSILVVFIFTTLHEHTLKPSQFIGAAIIILGLKLIVN